MDRCSWGIIPGVFLGIVLYGIFLFCGIEKNYPKGEKFSLKIAVKAFVDGIWGILTILIVVVGVVAGFLQRQSLQAIACVYSIIVVLFIYKSVSIRELFGGV